MRSRYIKIAVLIILVIIIRQSSYAADIEKSHEEMKDIPRDIVKLIDRLSSTSSEERARAAFDLGNMGKKAFVSAEYLTARLSDNEMVYLDENPLNEDQRVADIVMDALTKICGSNTDPLSDALSTKVIITKVRIAKILVNIGGTPALGPLIVMLNDDEAIIRNKAVAALEEIRDSRAIESLASLLIDVDNDVRTSVNKALNVIDPDWHEDAGARRNITFFVVSLTEPDENIRKVALKALVHIDIEWRSSKEARDAVPELIEKLEGRDELVREKSVWVLGMLRDPRAIEPLAKQFESKNVNIRNAAVKALVILGDESVIEALIVKLIDRLSSYSSEERARSAFDLGNMGERAFMSAKYLIRRLSDKEMVKWNEDPRNINRLVSKQVSDIVVDALTKICGSNTDPFIDALKTKDNEIKARIPEILGNIGGAAAMGPLAVMLNEKDANIRNKTVAAIEKIRDKRMIESVASLLIDKDNNVRLSANKALNVIDPDWQNSEGARRNIPLFVVSLADPDEDARKVALKALALVDTEWRESKEARAAVPELIGQLEGRDELIREKSVWVLGMLRDLRAIEPLKKQLESRNVKIRIAAVNALGTIGDERAIGTLIIRLTDSDSIVRDTTKMILKKLSPDWVHTNDAKQALPKLVTILNGDNKEYKVSVVELLEQIGWIPATRKGKINYLITKKKWGALVKIGRPASKHIIKCLKADEPKIRLKAAWTLGNIKDQRTVKPLILALKDEDRVVKTEISGALWKLTGKNLGNDFKKWAKWYNKRKKGK